jgi:hypothetical protein
MAARLRLGDKVAERWKLAGDAKAKRVYNGKGDGALAVIDSATMKQAASIKLAAHPESLQETDAPRILVNVPYAKQVAVMDRGKNADVATWSMETFQSNFALALDERESSVVHRLSWAATIGRVRCRHRQIRCWPGDFRQHRRPFFATPRASAFTWLGAKVLWMSSRSQMPRLTRCVNASPPPGWANFFLFRRLERVPPGRS